MPDHIGDLLDSVSPKGPRPTLFSLQHKDRQPQISSPSDCSVLVQDFFTVSGSNLKEGLPDGLPTFPTQFIGQLNESHRYRAGSSVGPLTSTPDRTFSQESLSLSPLVRKRGKPHEDKLQSEMSKQRKSIDGVCSTRLELSSADSLSRPDLLEHVSTNGALLIKNRELGRKPMRPERSLLIRRCPLAMPVVSPSKSTRANTSSTTAKKRVSTNPSTSKDDMADRCPELKSTFSQTDVSTIMQRASAISPSSKGQGNGERPRRIGSPVLHAALQLFKQCAEDIGSLCSIRCSDAGFRKLLTLDSSPSD
ncbi:unnamed protein product [Calicophoron daubneyi]|uniref:Uncharacterized protein n=1 Tax=Calicophoron daubneyi TaxID=300641 RepID=A0AAV2SZ76_CALDB